jgi:hypothetical protein
MWLWFGEGGQRRSPSFLSREKKLRRNEVCNAYENHEAGFHLGDHPNPAMCDHLKSGQSREGFGGRTGRQNKVVEKTAAEAALEIALRFPLSHNLCCWYHLAVRDNAQVRSSGAP